MVTVTILLVILLAVMFTITKGLECYTCNYDDDEGDDAKYPSCKSGEHPVKRYLRHCETWDGKYPDSRMANKTWRGEKNAQQDEPTTPIPWNWYCAKVDFDGKFADGERYSGVFRECWPMRSTPDSHCHKMSLAEWEKTQRPSEEWANDIVDLFYYFEEDTIISGCLCNTSKCNQALLGKNASYVLLIFCLWVVHRLRNCDV